MTKVEFQKACLEAGIQLNEEQMNQFEKYMQLLVEWNEKMNLTAITQEEEVWEKHFYDDFNELYSLGNRQTIPIPHINNKHNIVIPIFFNTFIHTSLVHFVNY